jgi:hypothetical protein
MVYQLEGQTTMLRNQIHENMRARNDTDKQTTRLLETLEQVSLPLSPVLRLIDFF